MKFNGWVLVLMYNIISYHFQRYVLIFHFWIVASQKTRLFLIFFWNQKTQPFQNKISYKIYILSLLHSFAIALTPIQFYVLQSTSFLHHLRWL